MYKDTNGDNWYKVGLHIHTTISDGFKTPEEAAKIYREADFDVMALTDHWQYHDEDTIEGLKIISGCEYNLGGSDSIEGTMHIVGVGTKEKPNLTLQNTPQEVVDEIKRAGGLAILAHPAWSLNTIDSVKDIKGFDAVEIYNSVSDVNQSSRPYSGYFVDVLANRGITYKIVATDDVHYYTDDKTKSYVMVKAKSNSTEDILDAIIRGDHFSSQGPMLFVKRDGDKIIANCSECVKIDFLTNAVWAPDKIYRGENLTNAEYTIKDFDKWVRVEVLDKDGNYAWSNIINL
jgi:predicted metal-dependent phosphoesterase TrpH